MKKLLIITAVLVLAGCGSGISEKDLLGKYKVSLLPATTETDDEGDAFAMAMFAAADIRYDFQKDGILNGTVSMGAMSQSNISTWKLSGDSIYLDVANKPHEYYIVTKAEDGGFLLTGGEMNLKLAKID